MGSNQLTNTERLFEQLCDIERLRQGFRAVKKNRGSPGIDGITVDDFELRLDEFEVAGIFEVPLAFLLDPVNYRRDSMIREGRHREFDAVPYGEHYIWGATAAMLLQFHAFLSGHSTQG